MSSKVRGKKFSGSAPKFKEIAPSSEQELAWERHLEEYRSSWNTEEDKSGLPRPEALELMIEKMSAGGLINLINSLTKKSDENADHHYVLWKASLVVRDALEARFPLEFARFYVDERISNGEYDVSWISGVREDLETAKYAFDKLIEAGRPEEAALISPYSTSDFSEELRGYINERFHEKKLFWYEARQLIFDVLGSINRHGNSDYSIEVSKADIAKVVAAKDWKSLAAIAVLAEDKKIARLAKSSFKHAKVEDVKSLVAGKDSDVNALASLAIFSNNRKVAKLAFDWFMRLDDRFFGRWSIVNSMAMHAAVSEVGMSAVDWFAEQDVKNAADEPGKGFLKRFKRSSEGLESKMSYIAERADNPEVAKYALSKLGLIKRFKLRREIKKEKERWKELGIE